MWSEVKKVSNMDESSVVSVSDFTFAGEEANRKSSQMAKLEYVRFL